MAHLFHLDPEEAMHKKEGAIKNLTKFIFSNLTICHALARSHQNTITNIFQVIQHQKTDPVFKTVRCFHLSCVARPPVHLFFLARFARHRFGCRILCRLLEHCTTEASTQRRRYPSSFQGGGFRSWKVPPTKRARVPAWLAFGTRWFNSLSYHHHHHHRHHHNHILHLKNNK